MNRKLLEDSFSSSWVDALGESFFSSTGFAYIGNYIGKLRQTTTVYPDRGYEFWAEVTVIQSYKSRFLIEIQ